ncbi:hypothetical protein MELA_02164 [Candidatus Methylomirabilis lanthanidiphila]|uniref:Transposase n=1 Tax=Candidatus Methylomirabilis lanthanidiphila TaxID=2211376 RepID=A0A564ZKB8_9BACT|nr:hypothetical protein MELA_02164 [Candidatus Methylomirabilis lanthanidiphila]
MGSHHGEIKTLLAVASNYFVSVFLEPSEFMRRRIEHFSKLLHCINWRKLSFGLSVSVCQQYLREL